MGAFSDAAKNQMLNNVLKGTASPFAGVCYVKLHTGDPGSAGTSNAATHTTRAVVTFSAAASGAIVSNAAALFTSMAANETISWISLWDASTSGNFLGRDDLAVSKAAVLGDNFQIDSGAISASV